MSSCYGAFSSDLVFKAGQTVPHHLVNPQSLVGDLMGIKVQWSFNTKDS